MNILQLSPQYLRELEYRYYSKIRYCEHGPECEDCCFPWRASTNTNGYGKISINGKYALAHRIGFALYFRCDIPDEQEIRHYCDYRACQQTHHLLPGTHAENMADMLLSGTGGKCCSDKGVEEIRVLYTSGKWRQKDLANRFRIAQSTINQIVNRKGAYAIKQ